MAFLQGEDVFFILSAFHAARMLLFSLLSD